MLHTWSWPARPWQRVHIDFAGPFLGSMVMLVVDAYQCCHYRKDFTVTVKPFVSLTDNVKFQLTSNGFQRFTKTNGIKHICSVPYHAATNGEAERCVQTFKKSLKAAKVIQVTYS